MKKIKSLVLFILSIIFFQFSFAYQRTYSESVYSIQCSDEYWSYKDVNLYWDWKNIAIFGSAVDQYNRLYVCLEAYWQKEEESCWRYWNSDNYDNDHPCYIRTIKLEKAGYSPVYFSLWIANWDIWVYKDESYDDSFIYVYNWWHDYIRRWQPEEFTVFQDDLIVKRWNTYFKYDSDTNEFNSLSSCTTSDGKNWFLLDNVCQVVLFYTIPTDYSVYMIELKKTNIGWMIIEENYLTNVTKYYILNETSLATLPSFDELPLVKNIWIFWNHFFTYILNTNLVKDDLNWNQEILNLWFPTLTWEVYNLQWDLKNEYENDSITAWQLDWAFSYMDWTWNSLYLLTVSWVQDNKIYYNKFVYSNIWKDDLNLIEKEIVSSWNIDNSSTVSTISQDIFQKLGWCNQNVNENLLYLYWIYKDKWILRDCNWNFFREPLTFKKNYEKYENIDYVNNRDIIFYNPNNECWKDYWIINWRLIPLLSDDYLDVSEENNLWQDKMNEWYKIKFFWLDVQPSVLFYSRISDPNIQNEYLSLLYLKNNYPIATYLNKNNKIKIIELAFVDNDAKENWGVLLSEEKLKLNDFQQNKNLYINSKLFFCWSYNYNLPKNQRDDLNFTGSKFMIWYCPFNGPNTTKFDLFIWWNWKQLKDIPWYLQFNLGIDIWNYFLCWFKGFEYVNSKIPKFYEINNQYSWYWAWKIWSEWFSSWWEKATYIYLFILFTIGSVLIYLLIMRKWIK